MPMLLTAIGYWIIGFPVAAYLGLYTHHSAKGVWYGLLLALCVVALFLGARLYWLIWGQGISGLKSQD